LPGSCADTIHVQDYHTVPQAQQTVSFTFLPKYLVDGDVSWAQKFEMNLQRDMSALGVNTSDFGSIQPAHIINIIGNPTQPKLNVVPITAAVDNGGGSYTISWTVPPGAQSYRIKWGPKQIVDWIGFDPINNVFTGDPVNTMPWFAATNIPTVPAPAAAGSTQSITIVTGKAGLKAVNFSVKAYSGGQSTGGGGGTGTFALSSSSVSFGNQTVGGTAQQSVTITNGSASTVTFSSIAIAGTNAADFTQTNTCGSALTAGSTCVIRITFQPSTSNLEAATLNIADSATGSPQSVALSGIGAAATASSSISITTPAYGATVKGIMTVSATATAGAGVASVQFKLDGVNLGPPITATSYSTSWNTASATNGSHSLTAVAVDRNAKTFISTSLPVTVSNTTTTGGSGGGTSGGSSGGTSGGSGGGTSGGSSGGTSGGSSGGTSGGSSGGTSGGSSGGTSGGGGSTGGSSGGTGGTKAAIGTSVVAATDTNTTFQIAVEDLAAAVANCIACTFQSATDLIGGQTTEVQLSTTSSTPLAAVITLKQGAVNGTVTSTANNEFVIQTTDGSPWPASVVVITSRVTQLMNPSGPIVTIQVGQTVAVRGLLFKNGPHGGPTLLARIVSTDVRRLPVRPFNPPGPKKTNMLF
jgi:Bacterial Ig domain/Abnormal spindle-like microcephaly-assoc'd, ASPM-SPD-2-Hydin